MYLHTVLKSYVWSQKHMCSLIALFWWFFFRVSPDAGHGAPTGPRDGRLYPDHEDRGFSLQSGERDAGEESKGRGGNKEEKEEGGGGGGVTSLWLSQRGRCISSWRSFFFFADHSAVGAWPVSIRMAAAFLLCGTSSDILLLERLD